MSSLSQFNTTVHEFVTDLKKMKVLQSDVMKLDNILKLHVSMQEHSLAIFKHTFYVMFLYQICCVIMLISS